MTENTSSMQCDHDRRTLRVRARKALFGRRVRKSHSVTTWDTYLRKDIQNAFVLLKGVEYLDSFFVAFWEWEATLPLEDRLRLFHLESTYLMYVLPNPPTYQVWLPANEIRTKIFPGPVPPFCSLGYGNALNRFLRESGDRDEMKELLDCEQAALKRSQLNWTAREIRFVQYYQSLPYHPEEYNNHGRWVQWRY